jgi:glycerol-3-phosphate acyltransferase PlsX
VRFVGNVEGRDVYSGETDVIVCDGFTGNVTLKISEGLVETVERLLHEELSATVGTRVGYMLSREAFRRFRKRVDYAEYGGAPLIGLDGLCVIGHGRSSAKAVRSAIMMTAKLVNEQLIDRLTQDVAAAGSGPGTQNHEPRTPNAEPRTPNPV